MQDPKLIHWTAIKCTFQYIKGTQSHTLTYHRNSKNASKLKIYCDADWASNADRKFISGYIFLLAGGAIAWSSKKQSTIALSTAEAEYTAVTHAAKQVLWHWSLFYELSILQPETSVIHSDNQAMITIAHHPEFHACMKHIDITLHFLRDHIEKKNLEMTYINTCNNLADIFTKGLPRTTHEDLMYRISVLSC
jgi:hypothetical protein